MLQEDSLGKWLEAHRGDHLIDLLHGIQEREGCLSKETLKSLSEKLEIPLAQVYSAASFYSFFRFLPGGQHSIKVCGGPVCEMQGAGELLQVIEKITGLKAGESDDRFTIEAVSCIGCCDQAPAILVDDEPVVELTPEKIQETIESCKS